MCTSHYDGKQVYWRAPRPRPRLHRRSKRRWKNVAIKAALTKDVAPAATLQEAQVAITVLQQALRSALQREEALKDKLQKSAKQSNKLVPAQPGDDNLQRSHKAESGFQGVTRNKGGWAAHTARADGKRRHLGTFDTPLQAARAIKEDAKSAAAVLEAPIPAPRGEFDVEKFRLIPAEQQSEWQRQCIKDDDIAAAAHEAAAAAYLEQKKRNDEADFAYIAAQDRAAFWNAVLEMLFTPHGIGILFVLIAMMRSWFVP